MDHFGLLQRFRLAGHDRGGPRLSHRLALDYPDRVEQPSTLDIIPTSRAFRTHRDMDFALSYYHWFWFAQPHPFPEVLIHAAPDVWVHHHTSRSPRPSTLFHSEALADYLAAARRPENISGMCEDYRAAISIDLVHDRERCRARGRWQVLCPMLVLWGGKGRVAKWYDAPAIWREYCTETVTGGAVDCGHYLPEEAPEAVIDWCTRFFG